MLFIPNANIYFIIIPQKLLVFFNDSLIIVALFQLMKYRTNENTTDIYQLSCLSTRCNFFIVMCYNSCSFTVCIVFVHLSINILLVVCEFCKQTKHAQL